MLVNIPNFLSRLKKSPSSAVTSSGDAGCCEILLREIERVSPSYISVSPMPIETCCCFLLLGSIFISLIFSAFKERLLSLCQATNPFTECRIHSPVIRPMTIIVLDVRCPTLTDWVLSVGKFSTQSQREGASPTMRSLSAILCGMTRVECRAVVNKQHSVSLPSKCARSV